MSWWTEWFIPLLVASGFLLICKGGFMYTILLWGLYLLIGYKTVRDFNYKSDVYDEWLGQLVLGIIVNVVITIINIVILLNQPYTKILQKERH